MNNVIRKYLIACLFIFGYSYAFSQNTELNVSQIVESMIENISDDEEVTIQPEELIDHFYSLASNPVSVNDGTTDDLRTLKLLNDFQIHSLIKYREENGNFQSIYELQLVYGFDASLVKAIQPFITLKKTKTAKVEHISLRNFRHEVVARYQSVLEDPAGYTGEADTVPPAYLGDKSRQYYRYQVHAGNQVKAGVTFEKDPGEMFLPAKLPNGLDHTSGFFQINGKKLLKQLNLLDYHANWGQGLVLWTGFGMGKSAYVTATEKNAMNVSKYSSSDENRFLRGASVMLDHNNWNFTLLYSRKKLDANVSDDSLTKGVTSFYETGLHNTCLSTEKKDQLREELAGLRIDYRNSGVRFGISMVHHRFGNNVMPSDKLYKKYDFSGTDYQNVGIDYHYRLNKLVFYGEEALSSNGGAAFLNAALVEVHPKMILNILHRKYTKKYYSHYSTAFSESSDINNEQGLYLGMDLYPLPKVKLSGYADAYSFPWATFHSSVPSHGNDYFLQSEYTPNEQVELKVLFKSESKMQDHAQDNVKTDISSSHTSSKCRFDFKYTIFDYLIVKNRLERSKFAVENEVEHGTLFYQDIQYKPEKIPFNLYLRYYIFNTEGYNSRIYSYENDVLYTFSIPAFFDKGIRYYTMIKWQASRKLSFWARYSRTTYRDKETISSGNNEIEGNKKSEIKIQMRLKI